MVCERGSRPRRGWQLIRQRERRYSHRELRHYLQDDYGRKHESSVHIDSLCRYPYAILQGTDGNFYGTAGTSTTAGNNGIVFKVTPTGKFNVLHNFTGYPSDGSQPYGAIIQAGDGNFYGTTRRAGKTILAPFTR